MYEIIIQNTINVYNTCCTDIASPFTSPKSHFFYDVIRKELEIICPNNVVKKEHILKLSSKLGLDGQDEQVQLYIGSCIV